MSNHHLCTTTGLDLGLGFSHAPPVGTKNPSWPIISDPLVAVPAVAAAASTSSSGGFLTLRLWEASNYDADKCAEEYSGDLCGQDQAASPHSAVSSFSNSVKRERDGGGSEEFLEVEKVCSRGSCDEDEDGSNARKKLRLTKQQSALLEQNFKRHSTLNPAQKQALAKELNLRPRQVEVWFQNRRARTKLKQIEVECEYLKKCCESLTDENRKLQKEVQELKAMKAAAGAQPFYVQLPAVSNIVVCPSCERIVGVGPGESCPPAKTPYIIAVPPTARFFNPNNSSAAC